jgi:hypothetical protein
MKKRISEAIEMIDRGGDYRTFDEVYSEEEKEQLFGDDVDDLIDPRFRKMFERTQNNLAGKKRIRD